MDIYCPVCDEPFDTMAFEDFEYDTGKTAKEMRKDFRSVGCEAIGSRHNGNEAGIRGILTAELSDLMPDDMDGVASMIEDFDGLGML